MSDNYDLIREAILNKKQIAATYQNLRRELCPHTLGWKNGYRKALFFQFAGDSNRGLPPEGEWRCVFVDGLSNIELHDGPWHTGTNHSRPQTCVDEIEVEVAF